MKRYPKYKDSGVSWLGEIPYDWVVRRARFLCSIGTGSADTEDKEDEAAVPFYVRSQTIECISKPTHSGEAVLTAGDGAGVGKVYHHHRGGPFAAHQRVYVMQDFSGVTARYFYYAFSGMFSKVALDGGAKSTVDSLRRPMLTNFFVALPSLSEQERITDYLDSTISTIDAAISSQERLIELLEERRSAIITQAVTKGLDPEAKMKDSGVPWLGEVPAHWGLKRLRYLVVNKSLKRDFSDGEYVGLENIESCTGRYVPAVNFTPAGVVSIFRKGDVLFGKLRPYLQKVAMAERPGSCSTEILPLSPVNAAYGPYLQRLLSCWGFIDYVNAETYGSKMPRVDWAMLADICVPCPPQDEAVAIAAQLRLMVDTMDEAITSQTRMIDLLKERRSAIITQAVTGQIDIRYL